MSYERRERPGARTRSDWAHNPAIDDLLTTIRRYVDVHYLYYSPTKGYILLQFEEPEEGRALNLALLQIELEQTWADGVRLSTRPDAKTTSLIIRAEGLVEGLGPSVIGRQWRRRSRAERRRGRTTPGGPTAAQREKIDRLYRERMGSREASSEK